MMARIASAPGFLSCQFDTEILLSENGFVFLHDQDPQRSSDNSLNATRRLACVHDTIKNPDTGLVLASHQPPQRLDQPQRRH